MGTATPTMSNPWSSTLTVVSLAALSIVLLAAGRRALAGTTLVAPWAWAIASLVVLAATEVLLTSISGEMAPRWGPHLRFLAAATTFCPPMALLGAKRPQDRAWQFIVASLWLVVALPALQSLVYAPGRTLDLDATWRWFVWLLIAIGAANGLPTRFWPSWSLLAAAQGSLFTSQLPVLAATEGAVNVVIALSLIALALLLVTLGIPRRSELRGFDRPWRDFRDSFGALWALRISERFNAAAAMYDWPVRLRWQGLVRFVGDQEQPADGEFPAEQASSMRQAWRSLALRFVSPAWLAARGDLPVMGTPSEPSGVH